MGSRHSRRLPQAQQAGHIMPTNNDEKPSGGGFGNRFGAGFASLRQKAEELGTKAASSVNEINSKVIEASKKEDSPSIPASASASSTSTGTRTSNSNSGETPSVATPSSTVAGNSLANATRDELVQILPKMNKKIKALNAIRAQLVERAEVAEKEKDEILALWVDHVAHDIGMPISGKPTVSQMKEYWISWKEKNDRKLESMRLELDSISNHATERAAVANPLSPESEGGNLEAMRQQFAQEKDRALAAQKENLEKEFASRLSLQEGVELSDNHSTTTPGGGSRNELEELQAKHKEEIIKLKQAEAIFKKKVAAARAVEINKIKAEAEARVEAEVQKATTAQRQDFDRSIEETVAEKVATIKRQLASSNENGHLTESAVCSLDVRNEEGEQAEKIDEKLRRQIDEARDQAAAVAKQSFDEMLKSKEAEISRLKADSAEKLEVLRAEMSREIELLKETAITENETRAEIIANTKEKEERLLQNHDKNIADSLAAQKEELHSSHLKELDNLRENLSSNHSEELLKLKKKFALQAKRFQEEMSNRHAEQMDLARRDLCSQHDADMKNERERLSREIDQSEQRRRESDDQYKSQITALKKEYDTYVSEAKNRAHADDGTLHEIQTRHEATVAELRSKHDTELARVREALQVKHHKELEEALETSELARAEAITQIQAELSSKIDQMRIENESLIEKVHSLSAASDQMDERRGTEDSNRNSEAQQSDEPHSSPHIVVGNGSVLSKVDGDELLSHQESGPSQTKEEIRLLQKKLDAVEAIKSHQAETILRLNSALQPGVKPADISSSANTEALSSFSELKVDITEFLDQMEQLVRSLEIDDHAQQSIQSISRILLEKGSACEVAISELIEKDAASCPLTTSESSGSASESIERLQGQIDAITRLNEELTEKAGTYEDQLSVLVEKQNSLQITNAELENRCKELVAKQASMTKENKDNFLSLERSLAEQHEANLQALREENRKRCFELEEEMSKRLVEENEARLRVLDAEANKHESEMKQIKKKMADHVDQMKTKFLKKLQQENEKFETEKKNFEETDRKREEQIKKLATQLKSLSENLKREREEKTQLQKKLSIETDSKAQSSSQLNSMEAKLAEVSLMCESLRRENTTMDKEKSALESDLARSVSESTNRKNENDELIAKVKALAQNLNQLSEEVRIKDEALSEAEKQRMKLNSSEEEIADLRQQINKMKLEMTKNSQLVARLKADKEASERDHGQRMALIGMMETQLAEKNETNATANAQLEAALYDLSQKSEVVVELEKKTEELQAELKQVEHQRQEMNEALILAQKGAVKKNTVAVENLQREIHQLQQAMARKSASAQQLIQARESECAKLRAVNKQLQHEVDQGSLSDRKIFELAALQSNRESAQVAEIEIRDKALERLRLALLERDGDLANAEKTVQDVESEVEDLCRIRRREDINLDYLKGIVVQFLSLPPGTSERAALLPVLATLLQFDDNDYKSIEQGKSKVSWWGTIEPILISAPSLQSANNSGA